MKLDCSNCKYGYFCCKMRVRVNFWERLRIKLRGYFSGFERDPDGKWVVAFANNQCYFLKDGKCRIYSIRPKICRDFPHHSTCEEIYKNTEKLKKTHLEILREVKGG